MYTFCEQNVPYTYIYMPLVQPLELNSNASKLCFEQYFSSYNMPYFTFYGQQPCQFDRLLQYPALQPGQTTQATQTIQQKNLLSTKHTLKPLQNSDPQPKNDENRQDKLYNDIMFGLENCFPENKEQIAPLVKKIIDALYPQISANKETIANGIVLALSAAIAAVIPSKPVTDTIMRVVTPAIHNALDRYF